MTKFYEFGVFILFFENKKKEKVITRKSENYESPKIFCTFTFHYFQIFWFKSLEKSCLKTI